LLTSEKGELVVDEFQFKVDMLKHEMDAVQEGIRTYGQVQFTIKGWAVTVFTGALAFALDKNEYRLFFLCVIAVLLFWVLDSIFKSIQEVYIIRATKIEEKLRNLVTFWGSIDPQPSIEFPAIEKAFTKFEGRAKCKAVIKASATFQLWLLYFVMQFVIFILLLIRS
jgi:hypothetical protein